MTLPASGIHDGVDEAAYHADRRSLSSTSAKTLLFDGPRAYQWQKKHAVYKDAFDFGSVVHALVLGVGDVEVVDAASWAGKAAKEERARIRGEGSTPILAKDHATAKAMADAVLNNPTAREVLTGGRPEVSVWAEDPDTGILMRGRLDYLKADSFTDLKTVAKKADPREFAWTVRNFHYTFQAAWYQRILDLNGEGVLDPLWVAVSKDPPHEVYVHRPSADMLETAHADVDRALRLYRDCKDTDTWPGIADETAIHELTDRPWINNEEEEIY